MESMFNSYRKRSNKVLKKKNDDDFTVENLYYEPTPPSPEGNPSFNSD